MTLENIYKSLRESAGFLGQLTASEKNYALSCVMEALRKNSQQILQANAQDVQLARANGMKESLVDRLSLNEARLTSIIESIMVIIAQTDPVGQQTAGWISPEGLEIRQVRVPIGVCAIIYESRPNVTVDAFALAYKSGNAILLRGSSSALNSNKAIVAAIKEGLKDAEGKGGIPDAIALADSGDRSEVDEILTAVGKIDVALPRGGASLIKMVCEKARVPVIETGSGICHIFVDESADIEKALAIVENAKMQRPGVCNAMEVLLVHENIAEQFLPLLYQKLHGSCSFKCCEKTIACFEKNNFKDSYVLATEEDFNTEFLDYVAAIKVVASVDEAIEHINNHNTKHSESIITENIYNARHFQKMIDAACVYVNASTRFTDGGVFGFGAELGISTQKLHIRGPMGLSALTTTKYLITGEGQIR